MNLIEYFILILVMIIVALGIIGSFILLITFFDIVGVIISIIVFALLLSMLALLGHRSRE